MSEKIVEKNMFNMQGFVTEVSLIKVMTMKRKFVDQLPKLEHDDLVKRNLMPLGWCLDAMRIILQDSDNGNYYVSTVFEYGRAIIERCGMDRSNEKVQEILYTIQNDWPQIFTT